MSTSAEARNGDRARLVLFVDGDATTRAEVQEHAAAGGYTAAVAHNGAEGLRLFEELSPDCVVTDLALPGGVSGPEFVAKLRKNPLGAVIPILTVSPGAKSLRGVTDAVIAHDVDDYLEKPLFGERLLWRIGELLRGRPIGLVSSAGGVVHEPLRPVMLERGTDFLQGDLSQHDVATLFFSFYATSRSGKLVVMQGRDVRVVWFRRGYPVFAESNDPSEEIGQWLEDRDLVAPTALEDARSEWQDVQRSLGTLLVARGAIGARTWFTQLRASVLHAAQQLFRWSEGQFYLEYHPDSTTYDPPMAVSTWRSPAWFVVEGIRDHYDAARCRSLFAACKGPLRVSESAHFILRELEEPYYFENLFSHISGDVSAKDLVQRHPFVDDQQALAALAALWVVGAVVEEVSDVARRRATADPAVEAIRKAVASAAKEHPSTRVARNARVEERVRAAQSRPPEPPGVASILGTLEAVSAEVHYEQGLGFFRSRHYRDAMRAFRRAVELAPESPAHHLMLGQTALVFDESGPEEIARAVGSLREAVRLDPSDGAAHHWLGAALLRQGNKDEARRSLKQALELGSPFEDETRMLLGSS